MMHGACSETSNDVWGLDTGSEKSEQEKTLVVAVMVMLRWRMCRVTKWSGIRNERIRGATKVEEISRKV